MKHVFVETNFLVDLLRPFPAQNAINLLKRHTQKEVQLWLPWCCRAEATRTLTRVISEDLGFADKMIRFAAVEYRKSPGSFDKTVVDELRKRADMAQGEALDTLEARVRTLASHLSMIAPGVPVVERTLGMFTIKTLNPFDEMVAGAVLQQAQELFDAGERELYFCELDADLASRHPPLVAAYAACGLTVLRSFVVP